MPWKYNFDANNKQMIFNATETAKIPVGQIADTKEGSSLQDKACKEVEGMTKKVGMNQRMSVDFKKKVVPENI